MALIVCLLVGPRGRRRPGREAGGGGGRGEGEGGEEGGAASRLCQRSVITTSDLISARVLGHSGGPAARRWAPLCAEGACSRPRGARRRWPYRVQVVTGPLCAVRQTAGINCVRKTVGVGVGRLRETGGAGRVWENARLE